uniref:AlNc14C326G10649 protein n=1 Tax=Albugo laibachii Nc14 TaxID=890382 RepID=F0WGE2_9STRA|nr:AlNc14C91G5674 [Albugo laibachii Nc14]CCA25861.1 AlNc14C326G10649 [Albugo laibachii Nc14]|eukprot:CCA25861.1 AlNc14C326G10649 [Albugo laibachii Nc14]
MCYLAIKSGAKNVWTLSALFAKGYVTKMKNDKYTDMEFEQYKTQELLNGAQHDQILKYSSTIYCISFKLILCLPCTTYTLSMGRHLVNRTPDSC